MNRTAPCRAAAVAANKINTTRHSGATEHPEEPRRAAIMKVTAIRRALLLANVFNLLVSLYFIIIAIIALVQLRWYHQLTVTVRVRYLLTSVTSYFAFFILILAGLLLMAIFVTSTLSLSPRTYSAQFNEDPSGHSNGKLARHQHNQSGAPQGHKRQRRRIVLRDSAAAPAATITKPHGHHDPTSTNTSVCCSILVHLLAATSLVIILIIWLFNTGELVRDSISSQLEAAYSKYQFTNRTNYYTVAIDGMQDVNNCCGSLDYTDFPHQRSGLSSGHYPGSCCGKNIFGVNARVLCTPEEIWHAKQTAGCTTVLANYYDLVSILIVPVALVSLFVNIMIIASVTILKGNSQPVGHELDGILPTESETHASSASAVEQQFLSRQVITAAAVAARPEHNQQATSSNQDPRAENTQQQVRNQL